MKIQQLIWEDVTGWRNYGVGEVYSPQLVIFFGSVNLLESEDKFEQLRKKFPEAQIVGGTTAGEIIGIEVMDESIVATAIEFEKTTIKIASCLIHEVKNSFEAGKLLANQLLGSSLNNLIVISDGQLVNGSELVHGLEYIAGEDVIITGGLAGDGERFEKTLVSHNSAPESGRIVVIGLYGSNIKIGHGSVGGWDTFGPERLISKSTANILFELDGKPALDLYKEYLGEEAKNLPGSALLFPLMIKPTNQEASGTVRTVLSVDEHSKSMTFAGDIPQGYRAQLMMANFDRLVGGAIQAAQDAFQREEDESGERLAILISCVGRKMVLGQRIGDEVEAVQDILGENTRQIGFYSYGEISPHMEIGGCELHNQTMTITTLTEIVDR